MYDNRPSRDFLAVWSLQSFGLLTFKFCEDEGDDSRMDGLKITDRLSLMIIKLITKQTNKSRHLVNNI